MRLSKLILALQAEADLLQRSEVSGESAKEVVVAAQLRGSQRGVR
jgi:hypothetical protein